MITRRALLRSSLAVTGSGIAGWGCSPGSGPRNVSGRLLGPSASLGHRLRAGSHPPPSATRAAQVVIAGGGIAGLSAAYTLQKQGVRDILIVDSLAEPGGNAATPNTRPPQAATPNSAPSQRQGSYQRFGEPGASPSAPRNDRPSSAQGSNGGWKSFGTPGSPNPAPRQPYSPPQSRPAPGSSPAPAYSAPRQAPSTSAPARTAPAAPSAHPSGGASHAGGSGKGRR